MIHLINTFIRPPCDDNDPFTFYVNDFDPFEYFVNNINDDGFYDFYHNITDDIEFNPITNPCMTNITAVNGDIEPIDVNNVTVAAEFEQSDDVDIDD